MMDCNVPAFLKAIETLKPVELLRYLEVGCAYGTTTIGISTHLENTRAGRWQSVQLDKLIGQWAYNKNACRDGAGRLWGGMIKIGETLDNLERAKIYLNDDGSTEFLPYCPDSFDLVLIDACHAKDCCALDFFMLSKLVNVGGYVFFHDADPQCQGKDLQPHCQEPIQVRAALTDLGFIDNTRKGWKLVDDVQPADPNQRGCVAVRKVTV